MPNSVNTGTVDVTTSEARPVTELWDVLSERERAEFRDLAQELKQAMSSARSPEEARIRMLAVLETQRPSFSDRAQEYLSWLKKQGWDDRTWAQRLAILGLIATLPLSGKAAGLAAFGNAVRIAIPVVAAAGGSLFGSVIDLIPKRDKAG